MEQAAPLSTGRSGLGECTMRVSTTRPRRRRVVLGVVLALAVVASLATPAFAHYIKQAPWVYRSAQVCTLSGAEISHGSFQAGYNWGQTQSWTRNYSVPPPWWDCKLPSYQPTGYLALQRTIRWWNGSTWIECWRSPWDYNPSRNYAISRSTHWVSPPCHGRSGYYTADTGSYVRYNGEWRGDWVGAGGSHFLPTHSLKESIMMYGAERPPEPPAPPAPTGGPPPDEPPTPEQLAAQGDPELVLDADGNVMESRYADVIDPITGEVGPYLPGPTASTLGHSDDDEHDHGDGGVHRH